MLAALSRAGHWSRTNLRAGVIGMGLSHTLTAAAMLEVDPPQLTGGQPKCRSWAPSAIWALSSTKQANFTVAVVLPRSAWTRQLTWSAGQFRLLKLKPQQPR